MITSRQEYDAAVAELERLLDSRPAEGDVLACRAWDRVHGLRHKALELLLSGPAPDPEPEPEPPPEPPEEPEPIPIPIPIPEPAKPEEATMPMEPQPKTPAEKLETMLARLKRCLAEGRRDNAALARCNIRKLCAEHGLPVPPEAALAPKPEAKPKPEPKAKKETPLGQAVKQVAVALDVPEAAVAAAAEASVATRPEDTPKPPPAAPVPAFLRPSAIAKGLVVDARALLWQAMARLEVMPEADRAALVGELTLLRSASETALLLATGRVAEVVV